MNNICIMVLKGISYQCNLACRPTACQVGGFLSENTCTPTPSPPAFVELLKFITHGCIFERLQYIMHFKSWFALLLCNTFDCCLPVQMTRVRQPSIDEPSRGKGGPTVKEEALAKEREERFSKLSAWKVRKLM